MLKSFFLTIVWMTCLQAWAQVAELTVKNQDIINNEFYFDIYIRSESGGDIYLAPSDFNFTFNDQFFTSPTISKVPAASPGLCSFVSTIPDPSVVRSAYFDNTAASIMGSFIFINLNIPGPNSQSNFDERIAKINTADNQHRLGRFKVTGMTAGSAGLKWLTTLIPTFIAAYENSTPNFPADQISYNAVDPDDVTLPIELLSFEGHQTEEHVILLEWETSIEIENQGFDVERLAEDHFDWQFLTHIVGAGNSAKRSQYMAVDQFPIIGNNKYRLKQIDFDGSQSYSPIIHVPFKDARDIVFPNPVTEYLMINSAHNNNYVITDVDGRSHFQGKSQDGRIKVGALPPATYFLFVNGRQYKFIKQ